MLTNVSSTVQNLHDSDSHTAGLPGSLLPRLSTNRLSSSTVTSYLGSCIDLHYAVSYQVWRRLYVNKMKNMDDAIAMSAPLRVAKSQRRPS